MDYKFKFITLAGFPALHYGIFSLAREFHQRGIPAHAELQQADFAAESLGCSATRHQREVGNGYFDEVSVIISRWGVVNNRLARFHRDRTVSSPGHCETPSDLGKEGSNSQKPNNN